MLIKERERKFMNNTLESVKNFMNDLIDNYNSHGDNGDKISKLLVYNLLEDMVKLLRKNDIKLINEENMYGLSSEEGSQIPRIVGVHHASMSFKSKEIETNPRRYEYDYESELTDKLNGWIFITEDKYDRFIKSLNIHPYIYTVHTALLSNGNMYLHTKENIETARCEDTFVGEIIYADKDILRLRSKTAYVNNIDGKGYRGVEDYIYTLGIDPAMDRDLIMNHFIPKNYYNQNSIERSHYIFQNDNTYRRRINYLIKVSESYQNEFYDPTYIWNEAEFLDHYL